MTVVLKLGIFDEYGTYTYYLWNANTLLVEIEQGFALYIDSQIYIRVLWIRQ